MCRKFTDHTNSMPYGIFTPIWKNDYPSDKSMNTCGIPFKRMTFVSHDMGNNYVKT